MHARRNEVDAVLRRFVQTPYGVFWLRSALTPHGVIRVQPGQPIPVLHALGLPGRPAFILPQLQVRDGHRAVGTDKLQSGRPLSPGELVLGPEIRFELMDDPAMLAALARMDVHRPTPGVTRPAQLFSVPAHYLLRPQQRPGQSYVLYQHIFGHSGAYPADGYFYVGITTRSWQKRWAEHRRAIANGSRLKFHRVFREETAAGRITFVHHKVMAITNDVEALYDAEERLIAAHWQDQRRLNMIPGGKAGLRRLREWGLAGGAVPKSAAAVCGRRDRLSIDQVRAIRQLRDRLLPSEIARNVGARTVRQVRAVLAGKTYRSVDDGAAGA
ncbi:MAG TPA: hypothetical protein VN157_07320 [Caulobacter sp.]|nr:hypothetical protein [Caulobacter sp.]